MNMQPNQMIFNMANNYPFQGMPQQNQGQMLPKYATTLYIGDLDEQINEEYLYQKFCQFGQIFSLKIAKDQNKKSKGFAFITFYNKEDAEKAKNATNHEVLLINRIRVTFKKNIKELQNEANIFIKNVAYNTSVQDFDKFFSQFGQIFSSKLNAPKQQSLGYGYVQFENKESVEKCLEAQKKNKFILCGQTLECIPFEKRDNRTQPKTNIYLKNLPELPESELQKVLIEKCKKFGEITSIMVKKDPQIQKSFAFICFSNAQQAEKCYDFLGKNKIFNTDGEQIYVNWAQTRHERNKKLKDLYNQVQNETNLYLKNLKTSVTKQELLSAFQVYGNVTSCDVKTPVFAPDQRQPQNITQYAFVNFQNKDHAKAALLNAKSNQKIMNLFDDVKNFYMSYHQTKNRMSSFQQIKNRYLNIPQMQQPMPQMNMNPQQMQMMLYQMNQMQYQMGGMYMQGMQGGMPQQMMGMMNPNMRGQNRNMNQKQQRQNLPQNVRQTQKQQAPQEKPWTPELLKEKLQEFATFDQDKQRTILGELLFPKIKSKLSNQNSDIAPKITGMLIDFDVFEIGDIIEFLEQDQLLLERVQEAEELIRQQ